jgi:hypothetical protein
VDKKSNIVFVLPAILLICGGCIFASGGDNYIWIGVITASIGLLIIVWAMLTGRLKLFG